MKQRVITAFGLIAVFVTALFIVPSLLFPVIYGLILIGSYEIYALRKDELPRWVFLIILGLLVVGSLANESQVVPFMMFMIVLLFSMTVFFEWFTFNHVSYLYVLLSLLVFALWAVKGVLDIGHFALFFIIVATYLTDVFAYFGGRMFGKHKLIERISPNKTVEGAVIGYLASASMSLVFGYFFMQDMLTMPVIITSALLIPIVSQFGDLAFSLIKRHFEVKDFGWIFPGHGGVLDRIDSIIFSLYMFTIIFKLLG